MIRLLADENFDENTLRGLVERCREVDVVRVREVGLAGSEDPEILEWAAAQDRILVTHDVSTMTRSARERLRHGRSLPGVFIVHKWIPVRSAIEDLILAAECTENRDWAGQIVFLPF